MNLDIDKYHDATEEMTSHINAGFGSDIKIKDLAHLIASVVGYNGKITFDTSKPNGTPRKLLDSSKIVKLGWTPRVSLEEGLGFAYEDYKKNHLKLRG